MSLDIDAIAVVLMELFGTAFFFLSSLSILQSRKINNRLQDLREAFKKMLLRITLMRKSTVEIKEATSQ